MLERKHAIAILYFVEEAMGYRQSLHWLRRYWEIKQGQDLRMLIKEVARENFLQDEQWQQIEIATLDQVKSWIGKPSLLNLINDLSQFALIVGDYFQGQTWIIARLVRAIERCPNANWTDALSRNQVRSKLWLLEKMYHLGWTQSDEIVLVGGWLGLLPFLSSIRNRPLKTVVNIDIDPECHPAALVLNRSLHKNFFNLANDVRTLDFSKKSDAVIVDTIVEHFQDHGDWLKTLPKGTRVVLQGNDMFGLPDHVNCHASLEEFVDACALEQVEWKGQLPQIGCNRYMILGRT